MDISDVIIVTDMDGTLLNRSNFISEKNIKSIEEFMNGGGKFTFASGRISQDLEYYFKYIKPNFPIICYNGAVIYDFDLRKALYKKTMDKEIYDVLLKIYEDVPSVSFEVYEEDKITVYNKNEGTTKAGELLHTSPLYSDSFDLSPDAEIIKVAFWRDPLYISELCDYVEKLPKDERFRFVRAHPWSCEFIDGTTDKGVALSEMRKLTDSGKTIITVGDNDNDTGLLKGGDISFAVNNASDKAKSCADYILKSDCDGDALEEVINFIKNI